MARLPIRKVTVPLTNIGLDELNPRLDPQNGQREAIRAMVKQQGEKIINLAADITEHGLSAAERFMAMVPDNGRFPYISLDGNRRLVALKLLHEPMLAEGSMSGRLLVRLKKLADVFADDPIDEVELAVFDSREQGALWVARRHSANMNGVGQDGWEALDKQRFDAWRGIASREWQILELVRKRGTLDEADVQNLNHVPISTLRRLVADRYIRTQLGLEYKGGQVLTTIPDADIIKPLQRMVMDLLHKRTDVTKLALSEDRKHYFDSLEEAAPFTDTGSTTRTGSDNDASPEESVELAQPAAPVPPPVRKPTVRERRSVIVAEGPLEHAPEAVQLMYRELQRADADTYPHACAALLGVLVEMTLIHYLTRFPEASKPQSKKATPASKLLVIAQHAVAAGLVPQEQGDVLIDACKKGNLFAPNDSTAPACLPWPAATPSGANLRRYWTTIAPLVQATWP